MDEDLFHKITIIFLIFLGVGLFLTYGHVQAVSQKVEKIEVNNMLDMIYEKCMQNVKSNITTIKGVNVELKYENGVCVIK